MNTLELTKTGKDVWYDLLGTFGEAEAKEKLRGMVRGVNRYSSAVYKEVVWGAKEEFNRWNRTRAQQIVKDIEELYGRYAFGTALYRDILEEKYGEEAIKELVNLRIAQPCGSIGGRRVITL